MTLPGGSARRAQILVVDDHPATRRSIVRHLERSLPRMRIVGAGTMASARAALSSGLRGAVIDRRLPDGDGFSLVQEIGAVLPGTHRLLVSGAEDTAQSAAAAALSVQIAHKPDLAGPLTTFAELLSAASEASARRRRATDAKVSAVAVEVLMSSAQLPPSSRRLLELRVGGVPRQNFARALGVEETTVRSQVRVILRRTGSQSFDEVAWRLLRICDDLLAAEHER